VVDAEGGVTAVHRIPAEVPIHSPACARQPTAISTQAAHGRAVRGVRGVDTVDLPDAVDPVQHTCCVKVERVGVGGVAGQRAKVRDARNVPGVSPHRDPLQAVEVAPAGHDVPLVRELERAERAAAPPVARGRHRPLQRAQQRAGACACIYLNEVAWKKYILLVPREAIKHAICRVRRKIIDGVADAAHLSKDASPNAEAVQEAGLA